jgi:hypothetical protein
VTMNAMRNIVSRAGTGMVDSVTAGIDTAAARVTTPRMPVHEMTLSCRQSMRGCGW